MAFEAETGVIFLVRRPKNWRHICDIRLSDEVFGVIARWTGCHRTSLIKARVRALFFLEKLFSDIRALLGYAQWNVKEDVPLHVRDRITLFFGSRFIFRFTCRWPTLLPQYVLHFLPTDVLLRTTHVHYRILCIPLRDSLLVSTGVHVEVWMRHAGRSSWREQPLVWNESVVSFRCRRQSKGPRN